MTHGPGNEDADLDRTDELPVLSEDAVVATGTLDPDYNDDPLASTGEHDTTALHFLSPNTASRLKQSARDDAPAANGPTRLEREVANLTESWHNIEALLASNSTALAEIKDELTDSRQELKASHEHQQSLLTELGARRAECEQLKEKLGEIESGATANDTALETLKTRIETLENERNELTAKLADAVTARDEAAADAATHKSAAEKARSDLKAHEEAAHIAPPTDSRGTESTVHKLRLSLDSLENYIAGRKDRWHEMEATLADRAARIRELEREVKQRIARELTLEEQLAAEQAAATRYRNRLTEVERSVADGRKAAITDEARPSAIPHAGSTAMPDTSGDAVVRLEERLAAAKDRIHKLEGALSAAGDGTMGLESKPGDTAAETHDSLAEESPDITAERRVHVVPGNGAPTVPGPRATLICLTNDTAPRHDIVRDRTTIGRGAEADIRIMTHFVSRAHAVLLRNEDSIVIEDLHSTNGVFVNSVRVEKSTLRDGDWVTIGETQFRFASDGSPDT